MWEFFKKHFFQPDYYQFYIMLIIGFLYMEIRFRSLKNKIDELKTTLWRRRYG